MRGGEKRDEMEKQSNRIGGTNKIVYYILDEQYKSKVKKTESSRVESSQVKLS